MKRNLAIGILFAQICNLALASNLTNIDTEKIINILSSFILDFDIDACSVGMSCPKLKTMRFPQSVEEKIDNAIKNNQQLVFSLPAFPFRSDKSYLPTYAEMLALNQLDRLMQEIRKIYPRSSLFVITDGLLFNDLFNISDEQVIAYSNALKTISRDFDHIQLIDISTIAKPQTIEQIRNRADALILDHIPPVSMVLREKILAELKVYDHEVTESDDLIKQIAIKVHKRNSYLRSMLINMLGDSKIDLSIHFQNDKSPKIGINLFPGGQILPWKAIAIKKSDNFEFIHANSLQTNWIKNYVNINQIHLVFYQVVMKGAL